jgi:MoxR-like ATPase
MTTVAATSQMSTELATLHQIETELKSEMLEREEAIRAALVCLVAKAHMVLLGPPGTGKSELVKRLSERFCASNGAGLSYFVYLMTRFTTPEELFGTVNIPKMKAGEHERILDGKLPEKEVAFLDEVFKSSSAVLNTLLMVMNERAFDNGKARLTVPLISLFGASNEMPQGDDLAALWDRFLIRLEVGYLSEGNFEKLIDSQLTQSQSSKAPTTMSKADLAALQAKAASLPVPGSVKAALTTLRRDLGQKGIIASDRRWVQCIRLLQAHALIEGRDSVEEDDLAILALVLWNQPQDRQEIAHMVAKLANPLNARATELKDRAVGIWQAASQQLKENPGEDEAAAMTRSRIALECLTKLKRVIKDLQALKDQAAEQGRNPKRIDQSLAAVTKIKDDVTEASEF